MSEHTCPLCAEEALAVRCPNFKFEWELEEVEVDHYAATVHLHPTPRIGLAAFLRTAKETVR